MKVLSENLYKTKIFPFLKKWLKGTHTFDQLYLRPYKDYFPIEVNPINNRRRWIIWNAELDRFYIAVEWNGLIWIIDNYYEIPKELDLCKKCFI